MKDQYLIVGHRGFPAKYPENSLEGLVAAARAGAECVELDVQISLDGVPMVFHDPTLNRVTEATGNIWDYTAYELNNISCHEPKRFAQKYQPTPIATLESVCEALQGFDCRVFIEIKDESFIKINRKTFLDTVLVASRNLSTQRVIISFDFEILMMVSGRAPIGWVLKKFDQAHHRRAQNLLPEILVCDVKKFSPGCELWLGNWQWFLYDIVDPQIARQWHQKGVRYIETWDVETLLKFR